MTTSSVHQFRIAPDLGLDRAMKPEGVFGGISHNESIICIETVLPPPVCWMSTDNLYRIVQYRGHFLPQHRVEDRWFHLDATYEVSASVEPCFLAIAPCYVQLRDAFRALARKRREDRQRNQTSPW